MVQSRALSLDSQVLIAYLSEIEPIASLVAPILEHIELRKIISVITRSEVMTPPSHSGEFNRIEIARRAILGLPLISLVDLGQAHAIETAVVRGQTGLKLPDAAIIATVRLTDAAGIIGNDRRWRNKPLGVPYHHMDDILALQ
jgi:PIN domain nuclease of toxin-antitoxin system